MENLQRRGWRSEKYRTSLWQSRLRQLSFTKKKRQEYELESAYYCAHTLGCRYIHVFRNLYVWGRFRMIGECLSGNGTCTFSILSHFEGLGGSRGRTCCFLCDSEERLAGFLK